MNRREKGIFGCGLLAVLALSLFLAQSTLGVRVDAVLHDQVYDTRIRDEVRVVGIDDASLQALGAWPWKRDIFAQALDTLYKKGARLVVFDILFLEERGGDVEMSKVLEQNKRLTLFASKLDQDTELLESVYKESPYVTHGVAHVYPDDDGKVRSIPLYQKDMNSTCYSSLAHEAFLLFTKQSPSACDTTPQLFLYQEIPPKTLSFLDVVRGTIADDDLRDKVIFIGSNSLDIEDHFISQSGEKIPGVYVHASMFTTLLNSSFLEKPSLFIYGILLFLFILFILFVIFRLHSIFLQGVTLIIGAGILLLISLFGFSLHYAMSLSTLLFPFLLVSIYTILFRYALTEKKNSYIQELFGQFVHPKVLANILKHNNLKLGGEKKYITILFSDIRGFTTMTEKMTPEELVETLNNYLETMSPLIMEREGVIDKYIGDAIMAFWNAPVAVTHHEEKAVRASLAMIDALTVLQKSSPLEIGIGLHAGEAIVGNIGSRKRINYTIIGDAVNACSRLEGLTKKYGLQIIVSEQIKSAVTSHDIIWRSVDTVRVKGKREVMKLYTPMKNTLINKELFTTSEEAFSSYVHGDFTKARDLYKSISDTYSTKMVARIDDLLNHPPISWTGVWDWDEK